MLKQGIGRLKPAFAVKYVEVEAEDIKTAIAGK